MKNTTANDVRPAQTMEELAAADYADWQAQKEYLEMIEELEYLGCVAP